MNDRPRTTLELVPFFCRLALGGLFIFAGIAKLQSLQLFVFSVNAFKILPEHLVIPVAFAIPWTEVLAGLLLVLGLWSRSAALLAGAMLLGFVLGIASVMARGMDVKCSCFGKFEWPCTGNVGWCQILRNSAMIALALPVLIRGSGPCALTPEPRR